MKSIGIGDIYSARYRYPILSELPDTDTDTDTQIRISTDTDTDTDTHFFQKPIPIPIPWKNTDTTDTDTDTDTIGASLIYTEIGEKYKNIITSMSKKAQKKT